MIRILIIYTGIITGCALVKNEHYSHSPLETVVKLKSVQDYCIKDSAIFSLMDIKKTFNLSEKQDELDFWYQYIDAQCSIRDGKKTDNCTNYSTYSFNSKINAQKAIVEIIHNETNTIETYELLQKNKQWKIIGFSVKQAEI